MINGLYAPKIYCKNSATRFSYAVIIFVSIFIDLVFIGQLVVTVCTFLKRFFSSLCSADAYEKNCLAKFFYSLC